VCLINNLIKFKTPPHPRNGREAPAVLGAGKHPGMRLRVEIFRKWPLPGGFEMVLSIK